MECAIHLYIVLHGCSEINVPVYVVPCEIILNKMMTQGIGFSLYGIIAFGNSYYVFFCKFLIIKTSGCVPATPWFQVLFFILSRTSPNAFFFYVQSRI